ncbi:MAG: fasciclin, partial [Bacteroidales bacterium]|nr:fasciclin [Bacteroidales bacterium]
MKLKQIFLFMLPLLAFIACEDPYKDSTYQVYDENPISSYLSDQSEYSEWVSILKYANMFNALNQADQDFTAFVPNNEAV